MVCKKKNDVKGKKNIFDVFDGVRSNGRTQKVEIWLVDTENNRKQKV